MADARYELVDIILSLETSENEEARKKAICRKLRLKSEHVHEFRMLKHSIDARKKLIKVQMRMEVGIDGPLPKKEQPIKQYPSLSGGEKRVVIIGCGPAGIFAALRCIELGSKPIIVERGKDASARRFDLGPIMKEGRVIEDSNYCFGKVELEPILTGSFIHALLSVVRCVMSMKPWWLTVRQREFLLMLTPM